jgi:3-isopropylmalate dehydratase small subunit
MPSFKDGTILVAQGAWADGSSWEPVIRELQNQGLDVVAAPDSADLAER